MSGKHEGHNGWMHQARGHILRGRSCLPPPVALEQQWWWGNHFIPSLHVFLLFSTFFPAEYLSWCPARHLALLNAPPACPESITVPGWLTDRPPLPLLLFPAFAGPRRRDILGWLPKLRSLFVGLLPQSRSGSLRLQVPTRRSTVPSRLLLLQQPACLTRPSLLRSGALHAPPRRVGFP